MRGVLAEFIVARASGCEQEVANEWGSYDLETPVGIKVEVKSAAYVQAWHREEFTTISDRVWCEAHPGLGRADRRV